MTENPLENQPPVTPPATSPFGDQSQASWPAAPHAQTQAPSEPLAIWALVSAIGSWIFLPVVLAIVALVLASQAKRAIQASGGATSGDGLVTAARVIAWIHLALAILFVIFMVAFVIGIVLSN